ncbi:MAG TPA: copper resistance protein CopC, partial [Candidatus Limnocylindrales bacterium]|nr:copper resistance protein CopC [Candidatus Limnocylindrales bacterium]
HRRPTSVTVIRSRRRLDRVLGALVLAALGLVLGAGSAAAHAVLVASVPGDGEVVATAPNEIRLVFSEPLDSTYSSLDVLVADGTALASRVGTVDPANRTVLVAPAPPLADGTYTIVWRSLSADDGHTGSGSIVFSVASGSSAPPGSPATPGAGGPGTGSGAGPTETDGHDHGGSAATQATFLLDGGILVAFGLMLIAWVVLEPLGPVSPAVPRGAGVALVVAGVGAALLVLVAASDVGADPIQYAIRTRPGLLLAARTALGILGGLGVLALVRRRGADAAGSLAMFAAAAALGVTAIAGHAAAFGSPAPIVADALHLAAASAWVGGLVALVALATFGRADAQTLRAIVPRFSAVALVSIAFLALTGAYAAWLETADFTAFDDPYLRLLAIKVVVALLAFAVGAVNFVRDPADRRLGGLGRRVGIETGLAVVVVVVTAALTNGTPTADGRAIPLAPASTPAAADRSVSTSLAIAPGRPGPNRFVAVVTGTPSGTTARLSIARLDASAPEMERRLVPTAAAGTYAADVPGLAADGRWTATVVVAAPDGAEVARQGFTFGFGPDGLTEGRATPPIDPATASAILLLAFGLLATVFAVAGGRLPRVEPRTGRLALLVGGPLGAAAGLAMLVAGPRL